MATTLITGASSGIGLELSKQFAGGGDDSGMDKLNMFSSQRMSSQAVAKAGYQGYRNNEAIVIPGWKNRLVVTGSGFLPRFATRQLVGKMQGV